MKKIVRLTESDLENIVSRVIQEQKVSPEEKKRKVLKHLRKITEHIKKYDVEKEQFSHADLNYFIDMLEKIADHQDINL
jgi:hypothetical protein